MSVPVLRNQMTPQIFDPRVVIFRNILTPDGSNDTEWPGVNLFRGSKYFVTSACDWHRQTLDCSICGAMFYVLKRTKRHPVDLYFSEIKRLHILRENITAVCEHFRSLVAVINYTNSSEIRLFGFISDAANFIVLTITAMHRMSANAVCAIIVVGITSEYSVLSTPKLAFKFVAGHWPL